MIMAFNPQIKLLVVDDMQTMRKILKTMLLKMGFQNIHEADDGVPAWKMIQEAKATNAPFQFILSDWNMPGMTGIDLLKNIRADETMKKVPFILITAEGEQANVVTAVKAGVTNFIVKPFSYDALSSKIQKVFP
jgi:two-component system chemotaxis response regulator CheY